MVTEELAASSRTFDVIPSKNFVENETIFRSADVDINIFGGTSPDTSNFCANRDLHFQ
jgi:hypothetical protein